MESEENLKHKSTEILNSIKKKKKIRRNRSGFKKLNL